ncbi:hypothetical protein [Clostridium butyricum]|uniref:hypothetical protein n=1 Tax=Clostridium butyricum TaxID=1492 RepID=UPI0003D5FF7E|nr:hypothetical protein [Clostridium butyricum]ETI87590.1 MAG: hypothetical protein Q607_CBUC00216G0111 [Clostridium butyricum DORA_1]MDU1507839.1 hypothetical protein [Clostridium butyricum]MDU3581539.1 hypothetical protein [Clostridium butyricum]MDU3594944.1 hypothetical protein [Clostridium butyricum]MDU4799888.1 hypothetical protein [Clostridium butyricum]
MAEESSSIENKPFVKYRLTGIQGINIKNCEPINLESDNLEFIEVSKSLDTITIFLKENINESDAWNSCEEFIFKYIISLIVNPDIDVTIPEYKVDSYYNISKQNTLNINEYLSISDSASFTRIYEGSEFVSNIVSECKTNVNAKNYLMYKKLYSIMRNQDIVTKYLLLYDFLLDLVSINKKRKEQKNISDFVVVNKLNEGINCIGFYKTRRKGCNFEEDSFTYYRNEIAHAEFNNDFKMYEQVSNNINNGFINKIVEVINSILKRIN